MLMCFLHDDVCEALLISERITSVIYAAELSSEAPIFFISAVGATCVQLGVGTIAASVVGVG